jgi:diguanylate cyclase (GGDEF)-like protein/PAS domain S-box-containing protein
MAIVSPEGKWVQVNQALADLTGYPKHELTGMSFADITHPEDLDDGPEALRRLVGGKRHNTEKRYFHADGHVVWISLNVSAVHDENGGVLYLISQMQDITERREAEAKLSHQAMHDALTGLPNRTLFDDRIVLAKARLRRGGSLAVLFLDVDHFKFVNDRLGHDTGDRLLIEVSSRLRSVLRPSDTVSRFGGDEFALLCEGVDMEAADAIASRIGEAFSDPFVIDDHEVSLSASTGIVLTSDPDFDPDRLISDADIAMYVAKEGGGAHHVQFRHEMRAHRSSFIPGNGRPSPTRFPVSPSPRS